MAAGANRWRTLFGFIYSQCMLTFHVCMGQHKEKINVLSLDFFCRLLTCVLQLYEVLSKEAHWLKTQMFYARLIYYSNVFLTKIS